MYTFAVHAHQKLAARKLGQRTQPVERALPESEERKLEIHAQCRRPDLRAIGKRHVK